MDGGWQSMVGIDVRQSVGGIHIIKIVDARGRDGVIYVAARAGALAEGQIRAGIATLSPGGGPDHFERPSGLVHNLLDSPNLLLGQIPKLVA
jgi:hypothetical protein